MTNRGKLLVGSMTVLYMIAPTSIEHSCKTATSSRTKVNTLVPSIEVSFETRKATVLRS